MTLNGILRRIRRRPGEASITAWARRFRDERKHNLDGWTEEELEAEARRALETPEVEGLLRADEEAVRRHRELRRGA